MKPKKAAPGLWLVPTPLGNLGDVSRRAEDVLRGVDMVAAEDTRRSLKLLSALGIKARMLSYREESHDRAWPLIARELERRGSVALVSDAGSPLVSDPGARLVAEARAMGHPVHPLPGPSAVTTALMASGFVAAGYVFLGFPPARAGKRRACFGEHASFRRPVVFFEAPHRLAESLEDALAVFGDRRAFMAREMSKIHEEYLSMSLSALLKDVQASPRKGEVTMVLEGLPERGRAPEDRMESEGAVEEELRANKEALLADGRPSKDLAREWAGRLSAPKQLVYRIISSIREEGGE
jgi:16S rRNA (cytidine1402-2'-O)-methyltransferase